VSESTTPSQAIMFEPSDELELRAARGDIADEGGAEEEVGEERGTEEEIGERGAGKAEVGLDGVGRVGAPRAACERITFEQGYVELKGIVARLDDPELPIHEMFEGFRRGKGLEKSLRAYLQEREGELAELEEGNNLAEFEIVAPSGGVAS
jgi:exodeoxyribonuclease VII small subunit